LGGDTLHAFYGSSDPGRDMENIFIRATGFRGFQHWQMDVTFDETEGTFRQKR
jgi:hypothetical protein